MTYIRYPAAGGIPTYANFAALPATAADGAVAVTLDTDVIYVYNLATTTWLPSGGPGTIFAIGTIDTGTPSANGAQIIANALVLQSASTTKPGLVNNTAQSFSGNKTFTGTISASNLSGTNTGDVTLATFGSTPSTTGASLSGQILTLQPADSTHPGGLSITTQTIAGDKTFSGNISAANLSGTNTGDVTLAAVGSSANANAASLSGQVLTLQPASASFPGVVTTGTQTLAGAKTMSNILTLTGGFTSNAASTINGVADATQLAIKANSTQTTALQTWTSSTPTTLASVLGTGQFYCDMGGTGASPAFQVSTGGGKAGWYFGSNGMTGAYNGTDVFWYTTSSISVDVQINARFNGSANSPAIYFKTANSHTGFYSSGTDEVSFSGANIQSIKMGSRSLTVLGVHAITGQTDAVQLTITGNSAQTNKIIQVYTSGFSDIMSLDNSGNFAVGGTISSGAGLGIFGGYIQFANSAPSSTGQVRLSNTDTIQWRNTLNNGNLSLTVGADDRLTYGGTTSASQIIDSGLTASTAVYADSNKQLTSVPAGSDTQVLTLVSGLPSWQTPASGFANPMTTLGDMIYGGSAGAGTRLAGDTSNTRKFVRTLSVAGTATAPAWDTLVAGDIPSLAASIITSGTLATARGGTNLDTSGSTGLAKVASGTWSVATLVNADVSASAAIDFSKLATLTSTNILVGNGSNVAASVAVTGAVTISNAGVTSYSGTVPLNKGGTGQTTQAAAFDALSPMTASGDIIYGGTSGTGTRLAKASNGDRLVLTSGLPAWKTPTAPSVQKFTSGTSQTYTLPAGVLYIQLIMVGGGGGGGGSFDGGTTPGVGSDGADTTFGSNTAGKGFGANPAYAPGNGGTATLSGSSGTALGGAAGSGNGQGQTVSTASFAGGAGGNSAFGGGGGGGASQGGTGGTAIANTGGGGGGGGNSFLAGAAYSGSGGGAGAYINAFISSPSATYTYTVGAGGAGGSAGSAGGAAGGAGAAGYIEVREFYQ